jgi:predicted CoA-binding protein
MSEGAVRSSVDTEEDIETVLKGMGTVAVVGLSANPERPSFGVARYLKEHGHQIVPINPEVTEVLGEAAYPDLASVPAELPIDVVDVFRRPEHVPAVVQQALDRGVRAIWLQLGTRHEVAAARARAAGVLVVEDRCLKIEHALRQL